MSLDLNIMKENIKLQIQNGNLEEAIQLIEQCSLITSSDVDIYALNATISILQGNFETAENLIIEGLKFDGDNFGLNYSMAYVYEKKGLYLKALETYEQLVFNMENNELREEIIRKVNELDEQHCNVIQLQLENQKGDTSEFLEGKIILHLLYDSSYCNQFMHFMNDNFSQEHHKFIIICDHNEPFKYMNLDNVNSVETLDLKYDLQKLLDNINICSKIYIHYLFDYFCEIVCSFNITKPIYWIFWGGDLYNYIDVELYEPLTKGLLEKLGYNINKINKNSIHYLYREATLRKINSILCSDKGEFKNIKKYFITAANYKPFIYPNPVDYEKFLTLPINKNHLSDLKSKFKNVILIGNSANPTNNHLEILNTLKKIKEQDFCIITPVSYGGFNDYIDILIEEGKNLFGERFIPITNYLPPTEYYHLLKQVDVAIFNHNRSQGQGTICILSVLGKKVYVNENITSYSYFEDMGVKLFKIQEIENLDINQLFFLKEDVKETNRNNIIENYSKNNFIKLMSNVLS